MSEIIGREEIIDSFTKATKEVSRLQTVNCWHGLCHLHVTEFCMTLDLSSDVSFVMFGKRCRIFLRLKVIILHVYNVYEIC